MAKGHAGFSQVAGGGNGETLSACRHAEAVEESHRRPRGGDLPAPRENRERGGAGGGALAGRVLPHRLPCGERAPVFSCRRFFRRVETEIRTGAGG